MIPERFRFILSRFSSRLDFECSSRCLGLGSSASVGFAPNSSGSSGTSSNRKSGMLASCVKIM